MRNTYQAVTYFILAIIFTTLGSLTLTGCGAKQQSVAIEGLLAFPDSYVDTTVEVYGEVYTIENDTETSVIVRISPPDEASVQLLQCEFFSNDLPLSTLKSGQFVTIIGQVDIVEAVVFLRECKVKGIH